MNRTILNNARTHNLKSVSLSLDPWQLVAVTGVSGAGKSSLCIDTLYAEGQRRFVESFSPYARQFLERHQRPAIDSLEPVPAAVAVDRHAPVKSSRSTVATMADIEPYLSALFFRESTPICSQCNVTARFTDPHKLAVEIIQTASAKRSSQNTAVRGIVVAPMPLGGTAAYLETREKLLAAGMHRLWVAGRVRDIDSVKPSELLADSAHVHVVIDRLQLDSTSALRVQEAIEQAWNLTDGTAMLIAFDKDSSSESADKSAFSSPFATHVLRRGLSCPSCGRVFDAPRAGLFSYQSPVGACANCHGFGRVIGVDLNKVFSNPTLSLAEGAIRPWGGKSAKWERRTLRSFCAARGIDINAPWSSLTREQQYAVIVGEGTWKGNKYPGVLAWFQYLESKAYKLHVRVMLSRYRSYDTCPVCEGKRLNSTALFYRVDDLDLAGWHELELADALARLQRLEPRDPQGKLIRNELISRIGFLCNVGLGYLSLNRQSRSLSGGEAQRVSLTAALGASLSGALVVIDEPTVGLHASDIGPLIASMRTLAQQGNAVVVVEHDTSVIRACDRVLELGPGAGKNGGNLLFDGTPQDLGFRTDLPTGRALAAQKDSVVAGEQHRKLKGQLTVTGARANNLKNLTVQIPLNVVCGLSGPSGSGKSTLAEEVLFRALSRRFGVFDYELAGDHDAITGGDDLQGVVLVDQSPLGRTSRGNAATYTQAWNRFRALFAATPTAQQLGFSPSHFSFNVAQGRCEACAGEGYETVEMQFLADVSLLCPVCGGKRFKHEVLQVQLDGKNVAQVLDMTVSEVLEWRSEDSAIVRSLMPLEQLGLGYLPLGQPLSTLSGGEAQRLKIARSMRSAVRNHLFIMDEPSAGLHPSDVKSLIFAMHQLVSLGGSVLVVDHDLDVLRACDWIIDLGPGAGKHGGRLVDQGTPEAIQKGTHRTAKALRGEYLATATTLQIDAATANKKDVFPAIRIHNARENNLREVSCEIPADSLVVVTGPSGSGKSSLVFDVLFAEGQRRFLETLTPYARQFLPTLPRADVDSVHGLPPSIALEQRRSRSGSNSTVATVTEISHYLRLLYAKVGQPYCPDCNVPVTVLTMNGLWEQVRKTKGKGTIYAPVVQHRKGLYVDLLVAASRAGIAHARVDGAIVNTEKPPLLRKTKEHDIDLLIWQGTFSKVPKQVIETAAAWARGSVRMAPLRGEEQVLSTQRSCPSCGQGIAEMDPRWFSFNTRQGACSSCQGTGLQELGSTEPCVLCEGSRLAPMPRAVRVQGLRYHEVVSQSVRTALKELEAWRFEGQQALLADQVLAELVRRVRFLDEVGLGYLGLDRDAATLSGGEMQRLRLSAQLGAGLTGVLYVLDEPTIGLHPKDTQRLLRNLHALVDTGSTVVVVEHDADTIRSADYVIDLGPGGGHEGGRIVVEGPSDRVLKNKLSPTARALENRELLEASQVGRAWQPPADDEWIHVDGARGHNLKGVNVRIPTGRLTVVAGVSGSGKSTLVQGIVLPTVRQKLGLATQDPLEHDSVSLPDTIKRAIAVDQQPIGRTPRSVPATFLGIWDELRRLFASLPESQIKGFKASRYSFNSNAGGRCPVCNGMGVMSHEMAFLPDVVTPCDACGGQRFEPATLSVMYRGLSIGDVLRLTVSEAVQVFSGHAKVVGPLKTLVELGLGYVQLGQGSHTLSGGEAQRLKLAEELTATRMHRKTLYVLDEPTTGLHLSDVVKLVKFMHQLVDRGDTLIVIEHHPDVIVAADYVIELGPGGGDEGGKVVAQAPPRQLAKKNTATASVLRDLLEDVLADV